MLSGQAAILHVDMDAFFVSVELRRRPDLRGRPVIVGGAGDRGVVAAASYEARAYGVGSAMPSVQARRRCPHAVFLAGDHAHYAGVSREVMAILGAYTPYVEPLSLDEAFLDVSGAQRLFGAPAEIAASIRARIDDELGLGASVGVAASKHVAKLASEAAKPRASVSGPRPGRGVVVVPAGDETAFLRPLPVEVLWGVGPATQARLDRLAVATVGDLADLDEAVVATALGDAVGRHLHRLACGVDRRPVVVDRAPKSIGHEQTYPRDLRRQDELTRELVRLADATATRLREAGVVARTVTLKVRFADFTTVTRSTTVADGVSAGPVLARLARQLLDRAERSGGVRLLGLSGSGLGPAAGRQRSLLGAEATSHASDDAWDDASEAVDRVRSRFGRSAVHPASLSDGGHDHRSPGAERWGPAD